MNDEMEIKRINPRVNMWWSGWWLPGHVEQNRYLYDHELVVFTSGTSHVVVGDQHFTCSNGDALIIPPGVLHWTRALNGKIERYCLHFDWVQELPVVMPSFVFESTMEYKPGQCKPTPDWLEIEMPLHAAGMAIQQILPLAHSLMESDGHSMVDSLRQRGLFLQLLSMVLSASQPVKPTARAGKSWRMVHTLKQRIEYDYRSDLSMGALAKEFKITTTHMARAFRELVGTSPLEYMHRLRLEEAYRLLAGGAMNVSEAAEKVGFEDANYFSRLFRKKMGMAPSMVAANIGNEPSQIQE